MYACPKCGSMDLNVVFLGTARLTQDNDNMETEPEGDHEWDANSPMTCRSCDHPGVAYEFNTDPEKGFREMEEMRLVVPTYYGSGEGSPAEKMHKDEFDTPRAKVLIREADGIRIILGSHDLNDYEAPDVQVERRPGGWAIFLHPLGGSDAAGIVFFRDGDGRSYLLKESGRTPTPELEIVEEMPPEIDTASQPGEPG